MPDRRLPDWPAVLDEEFAAAYVSLSPTTFRAAVMPVVPPIQLTTRRQGWRRVDLDAWIDRQAGLTAPSGLETPAETPDWQRALERDGADEPAIRR